MALQVREKERKYIRVLPSLVTHAIGYGMAASAHNTIYAQMRLAGSTVSPGTANVGAHNTVCGLTHLEDCIVSVCHDLKAPSCRCVGYGPRYCG